MDSKWKAKIAGLLAAFFVLVLVGTGFSRVADSLNTAKVTVSSPEGKSLVLRLSGNGFMEAEQDSYLFLNESFLIEEVLVGKGSKVSAGTPLLRYRLEDIREAMSAVKKNIGELELALLEYRGKEVSTERSDAERNLEYAKEDLLDAEEDYEAAKLKYEQGGPKEEKKLLQSKKEELAVLQENYEDLLEAASDSLRSVLNSLTQAKDAYDKQAAENEKGSILLAEYLALALDKDSKFADRNKALENLKILMYGGENAYREHCDLLAEQAISQNPAGMALASRRDVALDTALQAYVRAVKLKNERIPQTGGGTEDTEGIEGDTTVKPADPAEQEKLLRECEEREEAVLQALYTREILAAMRKSLSDKTYEIEKVQEDYNYQKEKNDRAAGRAAEKVKKAEDSIKAIQDGTYNYEQELEGLKQAVEAAGDIIKQRKKSIEQAEEALEAVGIKEAAAAGKLAVDMEKERLQKKAGEEALAEAKGRLKELKELLAADGVFSCTGDGEIAAVRVEGGTRGNTEQAAFTLGSGRIIFSGYADKEREADVAPGDSINIKIKGVKNEIMGEVSSVETVMKDGEEVLKIKAVLPEGTYQSGLGAEYTIERKSEFYYTCIPLSAFRQDSKGSYVLVMREKNSILGNEKVLARIEVELVEKDNNYAAVSGGLVNDDSIVTGSSKSVREGERVRVKGE